MTTSVPRHGFPAIADRERFLRALDKRSADAIDRLTDASEMLNLTFGVAMSTSMAHCIGDPTADKFETWDAFVTAMQVGSALFRSATSTAGADVESRIAHKMRTIPGTGPQHYADAGNWLTAFWLAIVCREQGRLTELSQVPISLLRDSGAVFEEYIYPWVDSLQTYWQESPGLGDKLVAAFEGTDPDRLQVVDRELMLKILYPPLNLFHRLIARDPGQFNAALVQALELHKEYWTKNEDRSVSAEGAVALGPLAIACLAYDAGFPIEVESEYLPENLLKRSWLGEFET